MENASKALLIVGAVLLSIMIISLLVYTARSFGLIAQAEEEAKYTADMQAFNEEFEIFDKSLMYGTDVLSCLNKAQNNNQKYVNNNYFGNDRSDAVTRRNILINVEVKIKKSIQESVRVYYLNSAGKKVQFTGAVSSTCTDQLFNPSSKFHFDIPANVIWYYFDDGEVIEQTGTYENKLWPTGQKIGGRPVKTSYARTVTFNTTLTNGTYDLFSGTGTDNGRIGQLAALLSVATLTEQTIVNEDYAYTSTDWYCATWRTAAYDFKTRKFKCTGIEYNADTGYVSEIKFEEI